MFEDISMAVVVWMKERKGIGTIAKRAALGFSKEGVGFGWESESERQRERLCSNCKSEKTEEQEK